MFLSTDYYTNNVIIKGIKNEQTELLKCVKIERLP